MSARRWLTRLVVAGIAAVGQASSGLAPRAAAQDELEPADVEGMMTSPAERSIERGLEWLAARQNPDGSFGAHPQYSGNVSVVGLCGLAMLASGSTPTRGPYAAEIARAVEYLQHHTRDDGLILNPDYPSQGPMYGQGFGLLFLAEAYGMTADDQRLKPLLSAAIELVVNTQNPQGGWRYQPVPDEADISVTVCQVMALRSAKNAGFFVPADTIDRAVTYIKHLQNADGGFSYRWEDERLSAFPRSAGAVVALQSAGIYQGPEIDSAIEYLETFRPDRRGHETFNYYLYGHYYGVQAMWFVGGERWQRWFPSVRDDMIARQLPAGSWESPYSDEYGTAMALIMLQMPNNILPIFQR
jgi:hypothetical protein